MIKLTFCKENCINLLNWKVYTAQCILITVFTSSTFRIFWHLKGFFGASLMAQLVKNLPAMWETWVQSPGWEDPLEKGMATYASILAWRIPWDCERDGHDWMTFNYFLLEIFFKMQTHGHHHISNLITLHMPVIFYAWQTQSAITQSLCVLDSVGTYTHLCWCE